MIFKWIKKIFMTIFITVIILILGIWGFMQLPQFGKAPFGASLERILNSPNYKNGEFQNQSKTPMMVNNSESDGFFKIFKKFFFDKSRNTVPTSILPSQKVDLLHLDPKENILVWFGHSSYFMQIDGKTMLVDPIFSGHASPFSFMIKSFSGSDVYGVDDMPKIDYLFITHDHYDHLDYKTVKKLEPKVTSVITGLGVGATLERWGYSNNKIIEKDWNEHFILDDDFTIDTAPARHFSGRDFKRNQTLWLAFILTTPSKKIYLGGDGGYDKHFKEIGDKFGPFDLAILEDGQYNPAWRYIHMMPEETVEAALDLKAKRLLPVHWGKFKLAYNAWDDGINRAVVEAKIKNMPLLTPMIGEKVNLDNMIQGKEWWKSQYKQGPSLFK